VGGRDSGQRDHHKPVASGGQPPGRDAGILTKHESVADFANKGEEELIQHYSAPIRWWGIATL